jgi:hypothetical protein
MGMTTTRRDMIRLATSAAAYAGGAAIVGGGIALAGEAHGATRPDNAIERHAQQIRAGYRALEAADIDDDAAVAPIWHRIDRAETALRSQVASTPHGAELQLWVALHHAVTTGTHDAIIQSHNLAAVEKIDGELDWTARMIVAAIRSLRSQGAQA